MPKPLKTHLSIQSQLDLLESRNLKIANHKKAREILEHVNYYRFTGYLFDSRLQNQENYQTGETFTNTIKRYEFDKKLNRLLMYVMSDIEETLKTRFSYTLSSNFPNDPLIYLKKCVYKDDKELRRFKSIFNRTKKSDSKIPFIAHHIQEYGGDLPIWVAVEIMTMGNLDALYSNLKTRYQKEIAKKYQTGPNQLKSWVYNMRCTRNHLAHEMRLYKYNFARIPASCKNHSKIVTNSGLLFDQVAVMYFMYSDARDWNKYVLPELESLFRTYQHYVKPSDFGFPRRWRSLLMKKE